VGITLATYVYCLIAGRVRPAVPRAPAGLPGIGPVRLLDVAGDGRGRGLKHWLAVSEAPPARYSEDAINQRLSDLDWVSRAAIAHEAVIESFIDQPAVVPMKLFTIFTSDEAAVARSQADAARVSRLLRKLRGKSEWGVRLRRSAKAPPPRAASRAQSGREFLQQKLLARQAQGGTRAGDRATADRVHRELKRLAGAAVRKPPADEAGRLLLDAVFLATRAEAAALRRAVATRARALSAEGLDLVLTGPWPAYHFLDAGR
jgi:hypothetical protein